jgi:hypothetical protein
MTIDKATESGWRPVTKQDLIDLFDGAEPLAARFRDFDQQTWRERYLFGFESDGSNIRYLEGDASWRGRTVQWRQCEIKTQVLRDPKFSDLENGPIECLTYSDDNPTGSPLKAFLIGIQHRPNHINTTGIAYHVRYLTDRHNDTPRLRWHVKVVDDGKPTLAPITRPSQAESITDDGWRTPTAEDLAYGPIQCEVRDTLDADWRKRELLRISSGSHYPYLTSGSGWRFCRIRK